MSCSDDGNSGLNSSDTESQPYYGTYVLKDKDCSGNDIQYLTISGSKVSIFDYLGDSCDDTVGCYAINIFDISNLLGDTILNISNENSEISNSIIQIISDSLVILSFNEIDERVEQEWEKTKNELLLFTPTCEQEYENTKDLADMMIYAVSDNGDLLWKNYIHGGIWDIGTSVTTTDDGGYIVLGKLDAIEWGGCCYTFDSDARDLIKLNSLGEIEWEKEITYSNYGVADNYLNLRNAPGLFKTSQNDIFFTSLTGSRTGSNIILMNQQGDLIWSRSYQEFYASAITENSSDQLVLLGRSDSSLVLKALDNASGDIISEKEYLGLYFPTAASYSGKGIVVTGFIKRPDSLDYSPTYLLKIDSQGNEIWRKIWNQETERSHVPLDVIETNNGGFLIFTSTDPPPYATLIKTDSNGNEEWRKKYDDYIGNGQGSIYQTEDGGFFMTSGYAVTKLNAEGSVDWQAANSNGFKKVFNNGIVSGLNSSMEKIQGGAIMVGYGSAGWE